MTFRDEWLDALNAAVFGQHPNLYPFANRPCGRLDAEYRQKPDLSPEDIEASLEAAAWRRSVGND